MSGVLHRLTCISCPRGCRLEVKEINGELTVSGNCCVQGAEYARQEILEPRRVLTCLMWPEGAVRPVSVRTDRPVPKDLLMECARQIYRTHPGLPIHRGDVLIADVCGTGAQVIATREGEGS